MIGLLNVGSLVLGLIAWVLPAVNLMRHEKDGDRNWAVLSVMSVSACAIALFFQIFYNFHLVRIGDLSALMDTMRAVALASGILLTVTLLLNAITLFVYRDRKAKRENRPESGNQGY